MQTGSTRARAFKRAVSQPERSRSERDLFASRKRRKRDLHERARFIRTRLRIA